VVYGYSVAFAISARLLALGAIVSAVFISARKTDVTADLLGTVTA